MTIYTNLFPNPRPTPASSAGWGKADGAGGVATSSTITGAAGPGGDSARRATVGTAPTNMGLTVFAGNSAGIIPVTPGNAYSATAYVRCSKSQDVLTRIVYHTSTAYTTQVASVDGPTISIAANTWTEVKFEGDIAPATAAVGRIIVSGAASGTLWVAGDTLDVQAATLVQSATVPQPFHGGMTSDATHTYAWTGTADSSTSTLVVPTTLGADVSGSGSLSVAVSAFASLAVPLSGSGTLTTAAPPVIRAAPLSGSGTLSATVVVGNSAWDPNAPWIPSAPWGADPVPMPVALSGSGTLSATATLLVTPPPISVALSGSGTLTTASTPRKTLAASFAGDGALLIGLAINVPNTESVWVALVPIYLGVGSRIVRSYSPGHLVPNSAVVNFPAEFAGKVRSEVRATL